MNRQQTIKSFLPVFLPPAGEHSHRHCSAGVDETRAGTQQYPCGMALTPVK